jgi:hypothetical protein
MSSIKGFSKIGKYTGNGSQTNGPMIYTGFKPAWVLTKKTNAGGGWAIRDNARDPFNLAQNELRADSSDGQRSIDNSFSIDMLSNGFKLKANNTHMNGAGDSYVYIAIAENPFVTSTGIPATAR